MLRKFIEAFGSSIDLREFLVRMLLTAMLAFASATLYGLLNARGNSTLRLLRLMPLIALSMAMVTTVISSSLAIAVGMVGAISILRFRNVLQSHELMILFLALALGIAGGIGQVLIAALLVLALAAVWLLQGLRPVRSAFSIRIVGQPTEVSPALDALQRDYPQLELRHCSLQPSHAEWTLRHPGLGLADMLRLREFLLKSAPALQITWEHAQAA